MAREKLFDYQGYDKHKLRIADLLNITDVVADGVTMADDNGVVDLSMIAVLQRDVDYIMQQLDIGRYLKASQNDDFILTSDGQRIELV